MSWSVRNEPDDARAFRLMNEGHFAEALTFARRAVGDTQVCLQAHGLLAMILLRLGRHDEANEVIEHAAALAPGNAASYDALAHVAMMGGRHRRAAVLYRRAAELAPSDPNAWYNLASSERSIGNLEAAEAACGRAIGLDRRHFSSVLLRSELRVQTPERNHLDALRAMIGAAGDDSRARMFLGYALGKECDDLKCYDEAFRWFAEGAAARRSRLAYDVATDEAKIARIIDVFGESDPGEWQGARRPARHVFVMGLPRSGTTLLERILTGLPGVCSNGETDNFSRALLQSAPAEGGDIFTRAAMAEPGRVGDAYRGLAAAAGGDGCIVEKLPMNYLYLGAIARALPDAGLVVVRRNPVDSCFAMYRTLFGQGYPFSYDFEELARYYAAYDRLMAHWTRILGDRVLSISYEDLVGNAADVGARVAKHCRLAWQDAAIDIQRNDSASTTASATQIRRPIYSSSVGRWRRYGAHLDPLVRSLRAHGIHAGDIGSEGQPPFGTP